METLESAASLTGFRQVGADQGPYERQGAAFEVGQGAGGVGDHLPRVGVRRRVVVADGFRSVPAAAMREVPAQQERERVRLAWCQGALDSNRRHRSVTLAGTFLDPAVGYEVVPEVEQLARPAVVRPRRPRRHVVFAECDEGERAPLLRLGVDPVGGEEHTVAPLVPADRVAVAGRLAR